MTETFETENVLKDVLEVFRKHHIPVQTVALDVSMLDEDFDTHIPDLKTYKEGDFNKLRTIDGVPMLLRTKRRLPFEEIITLLEHDVVPKTQQFVEAMKQEFPQFDLQFLVKRVNNDETKSIYKYSYTISVECLLPQHKHKDYTILLLSIFLQLRDETSYPQIGAYVGWLVDEESGNDWGVNVVSNVFPERQEATQHQLKLFADQLPKLYKQFRTEIMKYGRL